MKHISTLQDIVIIQIGFLMSNNFESSKEKFRSHTQRKSRIKKEKEKNNKEVFCIPEGLMFFIVKNNHYTPIGIYLKKATKSM